MPPIKIPNATLAGLLFCSSQAFAQLPLADAGQVPIEDLRATSWRVTTIVDTGLGIVQHTGDDTKLGKISDLVASNILPVLDKNSVKKIQLKTADIRLSLPDTKLDSIQITTAQALVPAGAVIAAPIALLFGTFSKTKSASAVFCLSIDGKDYLGNDARLFRYGAENEIRDSIGAALATLSKNITAGVTTTSPACAPGWEGGQKAAQ